MNETITFHELNPSRAIEEDVRKRIEKLAHFYDRIVACHVAIERPHRHQRAGQHYRVRIDLTVPQGELVAGREPAAAVTHEDLMVALRDAFKAARRELEDFVTRRRDSWHPRAVPARAKVIEVDAERGFGRLLTRDGREIYFHRNSVLAGGFERLRLGDIVRFAEEQGDEGPQATTVAVSRRRRSPPGGGK